MDDRFLLGRRLVGWLAGWLAGGARVTTTLTKSMEVMECNAKIMYVWRIWKFYGPSGGEERGRARHVTRPLLPRSTAAGGGVSAPPSGQGHLPRTDQVVRRVISGVWRPLRES